MPWSWAEAVPETPGTEMGGEGPVVAPGGDERVPADRNPAGDKIYTARNADFTPAGVKGG